jgi:hypothetical protein
MAQYLSKSQLKFKVDVTLIKPEDLISKDTYDETILYNKIKEMTPENQMILMKASVQVAIIGSGQKSFGSIRLNGKEHDLIDIFKKNNIKYNQIRDSKYEPDTLSIRRLLRLFRYEISQYIEHTQRASYLFRKYDKVKDPKMMPFIFPSAEHLIEDHDQATYLYNVYKNLDERLNTNFCEKIGRVFDARNVKFNL